MTASLLEFALEAPACETRAEGGDWILRAGEPVTQLLALAAGELEQWRAERLLGIVEAPCLLELAAHASRAPSSCSYRASAPAILRRVAAPAPEGLLVQALCEEVARLERVQLASVFACDDFFCGTGAQLVPGPYRFGPFAGLLMLAETSPEQLARLLPPGVRPLRGAPGKYLVVLSDLENAVVAGASGKAYRYRETTPMIPCRVGARLGVFIPELYPDAYLPILLGREIYGFPKRLGRTRLWDGGADVIVDQARLLRARFGQPRALDTLALVAAVLGELVPTLGAARPLGKLLLRLATRLGVPEKLEFTLPVLVRKQIRSALSLDPAKWQIDELVLVPFRFHAVRDSVEFDSHAVSFSPQQSILSGSVRRMFRTHVEFSFGRGELLERYS